MSGGLFTYREVRNLRKAAATAAPREQAGSPKQAGTPPRQSDRSRNRPERLPKTEKNARTSRKASRQSETRSPEPKCGRRNETDAVSPESRRFRTEGAGGSAKVRKNRKTFRTVENRIRPAGGRYDFRNGNRPKPDAGNDRSETPPNKKNRPERTICPIFYIFAPIGFPRNRVFKMRKYKAKTDFSLQSDFRVEKPVTNNNMKRNIL